MLDGRVAGPPDQARQQGGLGQREFSDRLAEIVFRRSLKPVVAVRQIDLIAIHRENLLLGVVALDLESQQRLLNLPAHAAVRAVQEKRTGKLHGERAGAFGHAVGQQVAIGGACYAGEIHAPVLLEVLVFGGQDGVPQYRRNLLVGEQDAALQSKAADNLAVLGVKFGDDVRTEIFQRADLRQVTRIHKEEPRQGPYGNRSEQKQRKGQAPDHLAAAQAERDRRELYHEDFILAQMCGKKRKSGGGGGLMFLQDERANGHG